MNKWTRHGHEIPGVMYDPQEPKPPRARCGGPSICPQCAIDATQKPTDYQIDVAMDAYAEASGQSVSRPWMEAAIEAYESAARRDEEKR